MTDRLIALVDCNNFFASCERLFRPDIQHMATIVLSSNDGCVIARSNEAKSLGIKMGDPLHIVKELFEVIDGSNNTTASRKISSKPLVVAFSANFELYGDISRRVIAILKSISPIIEVYSIDEAFLDISQLQIQNYESWGRALASKIEREVGVPVSIGIAPTKTLCKIAVDQAKHESKYQGCFCLANTPNYRDHLYSILEATDISAIWGIGRRLAPKLKAEGAHNASQLAALSPKRAAQIMGINGRRTVAELNGIACLPISPSGQTHQTISRGRQFGRDTSDINTVSAAITKLASRASLVLRQENLLARSAALRLNTNRKKAGYRTQTYTASFNTPTADTGMIVHQLTAQLPDSFDISQPWHKAEITLYDLIPNKNIQADIFGNLNDTLFSRSESLMKTVDHINSHYGKGAVFHASENLSHAWFPKHAMQSPSYTTSYQDLPIVRANSGLSPSE